MEWEAYRKIYYQYELSAAQTRILRLVVGKLFQDYPNKLPDDARLVLTKVPEVFTNIILRHKELQEKAQTLEEGSSESFDLGVDFSPHSSFHDIHESPLYDASVCLFFAQVNLGIPISEINYGQLLYQQELSILFAQVDAFTADTIRVICQTRPEVLKKNKQIDWATVVSAGGWQEILDLLTDEFVYEFGWPPLLKRVKMLREQFGIEIPLDDSDWILLDEAENIRNVVTHNGGRVSREYINRTGKRDLVIGSLIPLTSDYLESIEEVSRMLVSGLFLAVSEKFFGLDPSKISGVWRRASDNDLKDEG